MKRLVFVLATVLVASLAPGEPLHTKLQGNELLVALQRTSGGSSDLPGIYMVDRKNRLRLVVAYGREPCWSPDHRSVAFIGSPDDPSALNRIDLEKQQYDEAFPNRGWLDLPVLPNESGVRPPGLAWTPSGEHIVAWAPHLTGTAESAVVCPFLFPLDGFYSGFQQPLRDWEIPGKTDGLMGRLSFGPDNKVAYEWYEHQGWAGVRKPEVWLYDRAAKSEALVRVPLPGLVATMNPLWSPDGKWLAVDTIRDDGRSRNCVLLSADLATVRKLPIAPNPEKNWGGVAWSPDSTQIILRSFGPAPCAFGVFGLVEITGEPNLRQFGGTDYRYQARWSPDGESIAMLSGGNQGADRFRATYAAVQIASVDNEASPATYIMPPRGMVAVSIDW